MKTTYTRSALSKIVSGEAAFEKFVQEIGLAYMRIFLFGFTAGIICDGALFWLIMSF